MTIKINHKNHFISIIANPSYQYVNEKLVESENFSENVIEIFGKNFENFWHMHL